MTKTYIKPETKTYKVELQQMCQASPTQQTLDPSSTPITETEEIGAKGFGFGFFEETEE